MMSTTIDERILGERRRLAHAVDRLRTILDGVDRANSTSPTIPIGTDTAEAIVLAAYAVASNVETTFSALKRKLGAFVRAKGETAQVNEVLAKILCFNLSCLVHEMHELGIDPKFYLPKAVQ
jgi:hypothetical protein